MDTDARIAAALERIADALERPTVLPVYRVPLDQVEAFTQYLKQAAPHVLPVYLSSVPTTPTEQSPPLLGLIA